MIVGKKKKHRTFVPGLPPLGVAVAREFVAFLRSPDAQAKLKQVGLDPIVK